MGGNASARFFTAIFLALAASASWLASEKASGPSLSGNTRRFGEKGIKCERRRSNFFFCCSCRFFSNYTEHAMARKKAC